jgi:uncharacterized membrane protein YsdA (DUF1294 family)/cold shock CspA family protein
MRYQGRITTWKDDKGFGFITPNGGNGGVGEPVFAHISSFGNRQRRPLGNEMVSYDLKTGDNGRPQAGNIAFVDELPPAAAPAGRGNSARSGNATRSGKSIRPGNAAGHRNPDNGRQHSTGRSKLPPLFACGVLGLIAIAVFAGRLPKAVLLAYLAASIVAFLAYALDKSKAQHGQWRIKESTLHLLALFGGWPGALAAQRLLRHKSAKSDFQRTFWLTVALNCGALGWLFSPAATRFLSPWQ